MDIDNVCTSIATAITTAALTINGQLVRATPFVPDAPAVPHFYTANYVGEYNKTFNSLVELTLTCHLILSRADDQSGQASARAQASTGAGTIAATFQSMRGAPGQSALSGACDDLHLQRVTGPRIYSFGAVDFYGLEFTVFVMG